MNTLIDIIDMIGEELKHPMVLLASLISPLLLAFFAAYVF